MSGPDTEAGIRIEHAGEVATITLCRPEVRNAQTPRMWLELRRYGRELPAGTRVVVVCGEGSSFSSGLDLAVARAAFGELAELPDEAALARIAGYQEAFGWLRRPDLISIAAVQGHAVGAGFQLALACDCRILATDAHLSMAEVSLGLVPDLGGTKRLVELVGYAHALELCVTGRRVDAAQAERIGLANLVVPGADLMSAAGDLASAVLASARDAVIEIKALLAGAAGRGYPAQEAAEREAQLRRVRDLAGLGE